MRKAANLLLLVLGITYSITASAQSLVLDGSGLSVSVVSEFAQNPSFKVEIDAVAADRVRHSFDLVMKAALEGAPVYGLNVGVGWNKDRPIFKEVSDQRKLDDELLGLSRDFNLSSLRAHGGGIGEALAVETVRAGMLIRLNELLKGGAGVRLDVANAYRDFLNNDIVPLVPAKGSIGAADITLASHIGLAMIGEWYVDYRGRRMAAAEALQATGLKPLSPVGKDSLAILSNNALTAGHAAILADRTRQFLKAATAMFALSLEGLNGNVAPFLEQTTEIRPFAGMGRAAADIREALNGSYLWHQSDKRTLQDPLSFRTMAYVLGDSWEALDALDAALQIHMNSCDDNPAAILAEADRHAEKSGDASDQIQKYVVPGGAIYPTANFEMLPVAVRVENLSAALTRLSQSIVMQTIRYENPEVTKLSRFLAGPDNKGHAFGAMQKPLVALYVENRQLAMPVSLGTFAIAGNIEDVASNAPLAVSNLERILHNMYSMSSVQLLHAAQAVDLRGNVTLGQASSRLMKAYRAKVRFVDHDRIYTPDFAVGVEILRGFARTSEPVQ